MSANVDRVADGVFAAPGKRIHVIEVFGPQSAVGIAPVIKQAFEEVYKAPFIVRILLAELGSMAVMGESFLAHGVATATIVAASDVKTIEIPRQLFTELAEQYPQLIFNIFTINFERLRSSNDAALREALKSLSGAIDVALMREANLRANQGQSPEMAAKWLAERIGKR